MRTSVNPMTASMMLHLIMMKKQSSRRFTLINDSVMQNITSGFLGNALQSPLASKRGAWHHCWPAACLGGDCLWLQTPPCLPLLCLRSHLQWRWLLRAWPGNLWGADTDEITAVVRASLQGRSCLPQEAKHKTP